eukprot:6302729-Pyramimonas_sp.AAC.1
MAAASPDFFEAPLATPADLHQAMPKHSKERLSRSLGAQYLIWSRSMELRALPRACAQHFILPDMLVEVAC